MIQGVNWRVVLRHVLPAIYVPLIVVVLFGVVVALTGAGGFKDIEQVAYVVGGSSLVLVFAHLARHDQHAARANVAALAVLCFLGVVIAVAGSGARWTPDSWLGLAGVALLLAVGAFIGLQWGRRWAAWRARRERDRDG